MTEAEKRQHRVCFTGHRPEKLTVPECIAFCGDQRPVVRSTSGRYFKGILASMVKAKAGAYAPH